MRGMDSSLKTAAAKVNPKSNQASGDKVKSKSITANSEKDKIPSMTFQRRNNRSGNFKPKEGCFKRGDLNNIARNCTKPVASAEAHGKNAKNAPPQM